jgi:hypothetical protein
MITFVEAVGTPSHQFDAVFQSVLVNPIHEPPGTTVIATEDELTSAQMPLCTTALNQVFAVSAPMVVPNNVVEVPAMSTGEVNPASTDFCQRNTVPVLPLRVRLAGVLPEQRV